MKNAKAQRAEVATVIVKWRGLGIRFHVERARCFTVVHASEATRFADVDEAWRTAQRCGLRWDDLEIGSSEVISDQSGKSNQTGTGIADSGKEVRA